MKQGILLTSLVACSLLGAQEQVENDSKSTNELTHSVKELVANIAKKAPKEANQAESFENMFKHGVVSGQIRSMYADNTKKDPTQSNDYATAVGGFLKYKLAQYHGFNAAVAFSTSQNINSLSGKDAEYNPVLSSQEKNYTELTQAFVNYKYEKLNVRAGRQMIDTPLADSDDIRMIANSFEAYIAEYELSGFELMAGHIVSWQGTDVDLDASWDKTGKDGTNFGGVSYHDMYEMNAWFYNITGKTNATYVDVGIQYEEIDELILHAGIQYLNQQELDSSGTAASIYGVLAETIYKGFGVSISYNKAAKQKDKESFSGFGGGTLYTNMDSMILDNITKDREVQAVSAGLTYENEHFGVLYAFGDFSAKADATGLKAHVLEHDIGVNYKVTDKFELSAIYVISQDRESQVKTEYDFNHFRAMLNYNF